VNRKLRQRLEDSGRAHRVRCQFDLDRRFYRTRLALAGAIGVVVPGAALLLGGGAAFLAAAFLFLPVCAAFAYQAYRMLRLEQPVIAIGR